MNRWILVGDIKDSRKLDNRKQVQIDLEKVLDRINEKYSESIVIPFMITLGDEFTGSLNDYSAIMDIILDIYIEMPDIEFRFGIAYGEILQEDNILSGRGYNNALEAVEISKKKNYKVHIFEFYGDKDIEIILLNIILHLFFTLYNSYTERQRLIIYLAVRDIKQQTIADKLGVSQTSISQSIQNINWRLLKGIYQAFTDLPFDELKNNKMRFLSLEKYIAFIGRCQINKKNSDNINTILDDINHNYNNIQSRFIPTVPRDIYHEFQGLLYNNIEDMLNIITRLLVEIEDLKLGIGFGDINTELKESAIGMDGTAFYRARKAVEYSQTADKRVVIETKNDLINNLLTNIFSLYIEFIKGWTDRQSEIVMYRHKGLKQELIAEKVGLKRVSITRHLTRAEWKEYKKINDLIIELINNI